MILSTLKAVCAAYHKKVAADLTVNSVDLFLVAANNVRRSAEQRHNFELSRLVASLDIDGVEGASLDDAEMEGSVTDAVAVTGTLSPDATGTYTRQGSYGTYPLYVNFGSDGSDTFFLWYESAAWIVQKGESFPDNGNAQWQLTTADSADPSGAYTADAPATGTLTAVLSTRDAFASIKEVIAVSRQRPDGTYIPLDFARSDIPIERDRTELEFEDSMFPYVRYPSDADIRTGGSSASITQRGRRLQIYPHYNDATATPLSVQLEAYGWLADYVAADLTDTEASDFFVEHAPEYLQWGIIVELNTYFKTFVPRQEGNVGEPQSKMDRAWRDLLLWDSYLVDSNTTRSR